MTESLMDTYSAFLQQRHKFLGILQVFQKLFLYLPPLFPLQLNFAPQQYEFLHFCQFTAYYLFI